MIDIRMRRLSKRYRLPRSSQAATTRLDQIVRNAIDAELLEASLERAGISRTDEICIRRVSANAKLNDADSNLRMATAWSVSIADAIAKALRDGGSNVVFYRSLHHALSEMVVSALRGDLSRSWAWKQLGIWSGADIVTPEFAANEVMKALIDNPIVAPAVLRDASRKGLLQILLVNVSPTRWERLASRVVAVRGDPIVAHEQDALAFSGNDVDIDRIVANSPIIQSLRGVIDNIAIAKAVAIVALVEADPAVFLKPKVIVASAVARLATTLTRARPGTEAERSAPVDVPELRAHAPADAQRAGEDTTSPRRDSASTSWGGLLFVHNVLREEDFESLVSDLPDRRLAWTLHQLALLLVPATPEDAAILAFAGLPPSQRPPVDQRTLSEDERYALEKTRQSVVAKLRAALNASDAEPDSELMARAASREAEIIADPAWIEVHLRLSEVTTDVRRAGLDLDPGWLPWLGVVMRFVYE